MNLSGHNVTLPEKTANFCGFMIDVGYIENPVKAIESYTKSTTTSSMEDSVFLPPTSVQTSWSFQCTETSHFSGFLAPEYASTPMVICRKPFCFHNFWIEEALWLDNWELSFCRWCRIWRRWVLFLLECHYLIIFKRVSRFSSMRNSTMRFCVAGSIVLNSKLRTNSSKTVK